MLIPVLISLLITSVNVRAYELKQVLILGRHNIRAPFADDIVNLTPNKWPHWSTDPGHLTPRGADAEHNFGIYFREYLKQEGFINDECPHDDFVYVLANDTQRTIKTATYFTRALFKDCEVTLHNTGEEGIAPIFTASIRDGSDEFLNKVHNAIEDNLKNIHFDEQYKTLDNILNITGSVLCKNNHICDLVEMKDKVVLQAGSEPIIEGTLYSANSVVDTILMSYYDGFPLKKIAWGAFNEAEQFKPLTKITEAVFSVGFGNSFISKHVAKPLLEMILGSLISEKPLTILVGHDTNVLTFVTAVGFKPYLLPNQFEHYPIGGKVVLQKWYDEYTQQDLFKANYVYQSMSQLRYNKPLSLRDPPMIVDLEIENCVREQNGHCPWNDFIHALKKSLK